MLRRKTKKHPIVKKKVNESLIVEGTWAAPSTLQRAQGLQQAFQNPIPVSNYSDYIYQYVGDDELFDFLDQLADEEAPDYDVRHAVAGHLGDWINGIDLNTMNDPQRNWVKPWDKQAYDIVKNIVAQWSPNSLR